MSREAILSPIAAPDPVRMIKAGSWPLAGLAALFLALTIGGAVALADGRHPHVVAIMLCQAPVYAAAAWLVLRDRASGGQAVWLIIGVGVLARAVILPLPPVSTDIYRYVWDGRVQAAGINPYRYVPADPALTGLRDAAIFPNINRAATAPTIYPPVAQTIFLAATRMAESVTVMKAALVAFEGLTVWAVLGLLRRRRLPDARILLYLWHPLPLWEVAGSGHVDAAAIGLMSVAILAADRGRAGLAGALLALGTGVKYLPVIVAPALYRRFGWRMPTAFATALGLAYLPYLGVGLGVFGYLSGYAAEEGLSTGGVFWLALLGLGWPTAAAALAKPYLALAALGLAAFGLVIALRPSPDRVTLRGAQALLVASVVALTPHYPWYLMCLLPLWAIMPSRALAWLTLSAPLLYGLVWPFDRLASEALIYGPFAGLAVCEWLAARRRDREGQDGSRSGRAAGD